MQVALHRLQPIRLHKPVVMGQVLLAIIQLPTDIIQPLSYSLDAVMKLKAVSWHWKTAEFKDRGFTNDKQSGFITQDIEKVVPEEVLTDAKAYKGIDYAKLTAVLTEALKAQQLEIERLQQQVSASGAQQQTIDALTQRLDKLEQSLAGKPLERTTVKKETK